MNTELLEHELREALTEVADALPATAASRIRAHDYRPRTRSVRPPVAAGALAAAAVAGAAVWVVSLSSQAAPAFAGWTATPTAGSPGQVRAAESSCRNRLASTAPPGARTGVGPAPAGGPDLTHLRPVLADTRGPFTWAIFAGHAASASCISGPSFTAVSASGGVAVTAPTGRIELSLSSQAQSPAGDAYSFAEGRAGAGVTAATLVLDDGAHVRATLQNGWFVAWWPGDRGARSAVITTSTGTTSEPLSTHAGPGCPTAAKPTRGLRMCTANSISCGRAHGHHAAGVATTSVGRSGSTTRSQRSGAGR